MWIWPPLVLYYLKKRKVAVEKTAFALFVIAMIALPMLIKFDLPSIPPISKETSTLLAILAFCAWRQRKRLAKAKPFRGLDLFLVLSMLATLGTAYTNPDPLEYGSWITTHIQGLTMRDSLSMSMRDAFDLWLPFFVGRMLFTTSRDVEDMLFILAVAGLWYSLACLVEIRMSPQVHAWIYGYAPHRDFAQTIRWGGFRPMVCMAHGLAVAMFMTASTVAASVLTRLQPRPKLTRFKLAPRSAAIFLSVIVLALKSTGAIIYAILFVPLAHRAKPKTLVTISVVIAAFLGAYPMLRAFEVIPTASIVSFAESAFGGERAQSIAFRFDNEDQLLEKAMQRRYFGWGSYGRERIYDEEMGKELTIADSEWIMIVATRGVVGFAATFAVLIVPIFAMRKRIKKIRDRRDQTLIAGLTLILAVYCLDMIPNSSFSIIPFILAGALWTTSANMVKGAAGPSPPAPAPVPPHYPQPATAR